MSATHEQLGIRRGSYSNPTVKKPCCGPCRKTREETTADLEEELKKIRGGLGDGAQLSYAGMAAYEQLRLHHGNQHDKCWNVTTGRTVGSIRWTPKDQFKKDKLDPDGNVLMEDTPDGVPEDKETGKKAHDQDLPRRMGELIAKTEHWCDVTSLDPPDGMFMTEFTKAITTVAKVAPAPARAHSHACARARARAQRSIEEEREITIRMLFGNTIMIRIDTDALVRDLTKGVKHLPNNEKTSADLTAFLCMPTANAES